LAEKVSSKKFQLVGSKSLRNRAGVNKEFR
jgi:hypothetical protein